jgi:hypothetical protein
MNRSNRNVRRTIGPWAAGAVLAAFLLPAAPVGAVVVFEEDFDGFSQDWVCCLSDCALDPGLPPGYSGFSSNTLGGNYGECNCQVTTDADRAGGGRGMRIYLEEDAWPTGENILKKDLGADHRLLHIRWYMRESTKDFSNFEKLFRIKEAVGQILIPEWKAEGSHVYMNLWDANTSNNHLFTGFDLRTDVGVDEWHCYEIRIDLDARQAAFWVDGDAKGVLEDQPWLDGWQIRNIEIGGNQYGHSWTAPTEYPRDYDDIVIATAYVGCDGTPPADEAAPEGAEEPGETAEPVEPAPEIPETVEDAADAAADEGPAQDAVEGPADTPAEPVLDGADEPGGGGSGCGCELAAR